MTIYELLDESIGQQLAPLTRTDDALRALFGFAAGALLARGVYDRPSAHRALDVALDAAAVGKAIAEAES